MKVWVAIFSFAISSYLFSEPIRIDSLTLDPHPEAVPFSFPEALVPDRSTLVLSTDLKGSFSSKEASLVLESSLSRDELEMFYKNAFSRGEWKILQSQIHNNGFTFLAEGFARRSLAVRVQKKNSLHLVHLFLKRNSSF